MILRAIMSGSFTPRHGFHDAASDADRLDEMSTGTDASGLAIACGASGLLVVDLDGRGGP